ncbi:Hsp20/alpha crystallin family protein [Alicyclobacillaceae bacterium I2511]|jgi:HSP20 family protein|nr:Hsp20/alpha crystallin family protein [Alicyclobacillaceae bacterium I2511]
MGGGNSMNNQNPFDFLKQLGQLGNLQKMLGDNFWNAMPNGDAANVNMPPSFSGLWNTNFPLIDVYEQGRQVIVLADIPGLFRPSDISLSVEGNRLWMKGNIQQPPNTPQGQFALSERHKGAFEREVALPARVRKDKVQAIYRNGVLEIYMVREEEGHDTLRKNQVPIQFEDH